MSKLFIVPTPVGNLEDITFRAVRLLREADLVFVEDTRQSSKLLRHYGIDTQMISYHQHNEHKTLNTVIGRIRASEMAALITDAGTPGISDPGFLLVRECIRSGIEVECLPGATAFVPALVCSGLPCEKFVFEGFLPVKKGRRSRIEALSGENRTMVFYESPYRLLRTLKELSEVFGPGRQASVSREISKVYEEHQRGSLHELITHYSSRDIKGEITLVVAGSQQA